MAAPNLPTKCCKHGVAFKDFCTTCEQQRLAIAATMKNVYEPLSTMEVHYYVGFKFAHGY